MKSATKQPMLAAGALLSAVMAAATAGFSADAPPRTNNVIIFVADGLRAGSVNPRDAPEMDRLQNQGVRFQNSHALFPTVTTANASAIATGHALGDTGDFGNTLYLGGAVAGTGHPEAALPFAFIEDDLTLRNLDRNPKFQGDYLGEESLLACASKHGCLTAAIGKLGPVLIQDVTRNNVDSAGQAPGTTIIIDDQTGTSKGVPLSDDLIEWFKRAKLETNAPNRSNGSKKATDRWSNGYSGNNSHPGTWSANVDQQKFFADALTKVVLPKFAAAHAPFVIVFWSRDPDGTQHNQGDSLNKIDVGINGPTSKAAVRNCDSNLTQIREALRLLHLAGNTDIFVTADHGFDTVSKRQLNPAGQVTKSFSATINYFDAQGRQEVNAGFLPPGFLAIDLAHFLGLPLYDTDTLNSTGHAYKRVDPVQGRPAEGTLQRPVEGNGLIGGTGRFTEDDAPSAEATLAVMANGGADLIYIPGDQTAANAELVNRIVHFLTTQDYVSGIFVDDRYGGVPGALHLSNIGLLGSAKMPKPALIVNFCSFTTDTDAPCQHGVIVADTGLQQGQGNHGGFDRAATLNFMAAYGPDFKTRYVDPAPVSNADIAMTLAHLLAFAIPSRGHLAGRVIAEALVGGPAPAPGLIQSGTDRSEAENGLQTILNWQDYDGHRYFDAAGFAGRTLGLRP